MVRHHILISVGLLVTFEVYLSLSFCDECPKPPYPQNHEYGEEETWSISDPPHAKYIESMPRGQQQPHPDDNEEQVHRRPPRETPRERPKRVSNRRKLRHKDRESRPARDRHRNSPVTPPTPASVQDGQRNISNVCNICWMRERRRDHRLESIKNAVLEKLEMAEAPNISIPKLPEGLPPGIFGKGSFINQSYHRDIPNDSNDDFEELNGAVQIVQFAKPPPPEVHLGEPYQNSSIVYFKLESDVRNSKLHHAILYLYILPQPESQAAPAFISIYQIIRGRNGQVMHRPQADARIRVNLGEKSEGDWEKIDVKHIVQRWIHHPVQVNLGLYIVAIRRDGQTFAILNSENEDEKEHRPCLKTQLTERKSTRSKRRLGENMNCDEKSTESRCCRYPLLVDFDYFGWEWIIQPRQYLAYYCAGNCPYSFNSGTPHAHVVGSILDYELGGPCCTPTAMSPISMIYYDDTVRLKKKTLNDMVVDRCGCK